MNETPSPEDLLQKARRLEAAGEDDAAKAAYLEALRAHPEHYVALCELGTLALSTGHRSAARTAYQRAIQLQPGNPVARVNLGNVYYQDGDMPRAAKR